MYLAVTLSLYTLISKTKLGTQLPDCAEKSVFVPFKAMQSRQIFSRNLTNITGHHEWFRNKESVTFCPSLESVSSLKENAP